VGSTKRPAGCLVALLAVALLLAGCGTEDAVSTTSTAPVTEPTTVSTATTVPSTTSTTAVPGTTVEAVVAWMEAWLADQFERSDPPEGVVGPSLVDCHDSGPIRVGGVLACGLESQTEPGIELDAPGVVIYLLDPSGRAVWEAGTDSPSTTEGLEEVYASATHGLMCKDLMAEEYAGETYPFSGLGRPEESAFFWSLVYWSFEGEPDRMDADGDGIPCETLHPSDMVTAVLEGGPVPLYVR
jgi:hypothetical protein